MNPLLMEEASGHHWKRHGSAPPVKKQHHQMQRQVPCDYPEAPGPSFSLVRAVLNLNFEPQQLLIYK